MKKLLVAVVGLVFVGLAGLGLAESASAAPVHARAGAVACHAGPRSLPGTVFCPSPSRRFYHRHGAAAYRFGFGSAPCGVVTSGGWASCKSIPERPITLLVAVR